MINRRQALPHSARLSGLLAAAGAGRLIPAWHLDEVAARHNGKTVLAVCCGRSVSEDPCLQFTPRGAQPGASVAPGWNDKRGATRNDQATVT